jgi:heptosyltransferase-2/heptosyltransferase-3
VSRIAVLRLDHIGDVIMAAAVLKPLKKAHPSASIDLVVPTWALDVVRSSPDVSQVTLFDAPWFDRAWQAGFLKCLFGVFDLARILRQGRYDAIIDLRGDFRHIFAMWLSGAKKRVSYGVTGGGYLLTDEGAYRKGAHQTELNMALARVIGAEGPA